jgi:hypothetical protein
VIQPRVSIAKNIDTTYRTTHIKLDPPGHNRPGCGIHSGVGSNHTKRSNLRWWFILLLHSLKKITAKCKQYPSWFDNTRSNSAILMTSRMFSLSLAAPLGVEAMTSDENGSAEYCLGHSQRCNSKPWFKSPRTQPCVTRPDLTADRERAYANACELLRKFAKLRSSWCWNLTDFSTRK